MSRSKNVSAGAVFLLAALYFFTDLCELAALLIAAAAHETGHIITLLSFGGKITDIKVSSSGFCMSYIGIHSVKKEIIALIAGPVSGIVFAFLTSYIGNMTQNRLFLETAGISLAFSLYNILPAQPLDGGRVLFSILSQNHSDKYAKKFISVTGVLCGIVLLILGLYTVRIQYGIGLIIAGSWILIAQTGIVKNMSVM